MKRLFATIGVLMLLFVAYGLLWLFDRWDYATLHYRLTYLVETPAGERSYSSVIRVRREDTTRLPLPNTGYGYSLRGEAVVMDLGEGKHLFSLIQESAYLLPPLVFDSIRPRGMGIVPFTRWLADKKPTAPVPPDRYPLLVTFEDINDPTSVKRVDPANLAASFGSDYALKSVTLEITDDPVTKGRVEDVLGWWCELRLKRARLNGSTSIAIKTNNLSDNLGTGAFRIGECS